MKRGISFSEKTIYLLLLIIGMIITVFLVFFMLGTSSKPETSLLPSIKLPSIENIDIPALIPPKEYKAKIAVVGDLMVHKWQLENAYNKSTGEYNFDHCFENVQQYLQDADLTIGNLETTFAGKDAGYAFYPTFNTPDAFGYALKNAGFDLLTTANNHSNDKLEAGIIRTIDILDELGIEHFGTYKTEVERDNIFIKEVNGFEFAFLSYSYSTNGIPLTKGKWFLVNPLDKKQIEYDIKRAKELNPDFIVIMPHMGNEYQQYTVQEFKDWVQFMFDCGADIVLASHPHVLQPMEFVDVENPDGTMRKCFVIYSLGNFISSQRDVPRDEGIILNLFFEKTEGEKAVIKNVSYIPTWVKWKNKAGAMDIRVLSVFDTLAAYEAGENIDLSSSDIKRLKQVHNEIANVFLNKQISQEEMQNEYAFVSSNMDVE